MSLTRPTKLPEWASSLANVTEPAGGLKASGWLPGDRPPAQYLNWLQNGAYEWLEYLDHTGSARAKLLATLSNPRYLLAPTANFRAVAWGPTAGPEDRGQFLLVGPDTGANVLRTLGYTGVAQSLETVASADFEVHGAAWGNGEWTIVGGESGPVGRQSWSADGSTINFSISPGQPGDNYVYTRCAVWNGTVWVMGSDYGYDTQIYTATAGHAGTSRTPGSGSLSNFTGAAARLDTGVVILAGSVDIQRSTNNGVTWVRESLNGARDVVYAGGDVWVATRVSDGILRSADNGDTWSIIDTDDLIAGQSNPEVHFSGLCMLGSAVVSVAWGDSWSSAQFAVSFDQGTTWAFGARIPTIPATNATWKIATDGYRVVAVSSVGDMICTDAVDVAPDEV